QTRTPGRPGCRAPREEHGGPAARCSRFWQDHDASLGQALRAAARRRMLRAVTLRVLHVDTERGWRGGERQTLWLARELASRGYESIVAARPGEPLAVRAAEAGLRLVGCVPAGELDPLAAWRLGRVVRAGVDLVHAHTAPA